MLPVYKWWNKWTLIVIITEIETDIYTNFKVTIATRKLSKSIWYFPFIWNIDYFKSFCHPTRFKLPNPMLKSKVFRAALFTECPTHIPSICTSKDLSPCKPQISWLCSRFQTFSMLHDPSLIPYVEDIKISVPAIQFCQT